MDEKEIFKHIFSSTSNGIRVVDVNGMILQINPQAERILKLSVFKDIHKDILASLPEIGHLIMQCLSSLKPLLDRMPKNQLKNYYDVQGGNK